jgi:hypothetical protein
MFLSAAVQESNKNDHSLHGSSIKVSQLTKACVKWIYRCPCEKQWEGNLISVETHSNVCCINHQVIKTQLVLQLPFLEIVLNVFWDTHKSHKILILFSLVRKVKWNKRRLVCWEWKQPFSSYQFKHIFSQEEVEFLNLLVC